jgi:hypothetical protein
MKKIFASLLLCLLLLMPSLCFTYAEDNIVEVPDTQIIIDGKPVRYSDVPISINNRTMLPLRALLLDLGVKNEDILWNGDTKSVTFRRGDTRVFLKIGSYKARVNGKTVEMDVAPVGYTNQRIYIPLRFVSQNLGKEVVWEGTTKTIYIRDKKDFIKIREILDKSADAMEKVKTASIAISADTVLEKQNSNINLTMGMNTEVDRMAKAVHTAINMPLFGQNIRLETYYMDKTQYNMNPLTGEWEIETMNEEDYSNVLEGNFNPVAVSVNEMLYAGLMVDENINADELILKGNIYLKKLFESLNEDTESGSPILKDFYTEIAIDRETMLINSIYMTFGGTMQTNGKTTQLNSKVRCIYEWYNQELDIQLPDMPDTQAGTN